MRELIKTKGLKNCYNSSIKLLSPGLTLTG